MIASDRAARDQICSFFLIGLALAGGGFPLCQKLWKEIEMFKPVLIVAAMAVTAMSGSAQAQQPNLAGTYRCQPEPGPCKNGQTYTVTQSGATVDFKNEKGEIGQAKLTSNISLSAGSPWNMLGTITAPNAIQWSDGTQWIKQ
jgi:hypothetical protein